MNSRTTEVPPLALALDGFPLDAAQLRRSIEPTPIVKKTVATRDRHICQWCGFKSQKYQDVVALSGHPRDIERIVTACLFCQQCFFLRRVRSQQSGILIWLPELNQQELNLTARDIYVARLKQDQMSEAARVLLERLRARRDAARERLDGLDLDEIANAGEAEAREMAARVNRPGIRLLPTERCMVREGGIEFNQFPQILAHWRSRDGPYPKDRATTPWLSRHAALLA